MNIRRRVSLVVLAASILAGVISSLLIVGTQARLVHVLTMYFSGFAGGASLAAFIASKSKPT
jgi:hypothetical protein